jgi:hypothetical protein
MAHTNVQLVSGNLTTGQASPTFFIDRVNDKIGIGGVPDITGVEADPATSNVLQVSGNMLATRYHGDGSSLTGIDVSKWALTDDGINDGINYVGNVGIGGLASATAATKLYVHGDIDIQSGSSLRIGGVIPVYSNWVVSGDNISRSLGNVGIGGDASATATTKLYVHGTVEATGFTGIQTSDVPDLAAGKITSGTFADARIPDLAAGKITSGTFADARIPDLAAGKITSGTFAAARIPTLNQNTTGSAGSAGSVTNGVYTTGTQSIGGTKTFTSEAKFCVSGHTSHIGYSTNRDWYIRSGLSAGKVILQDTGGNVGIGTSSPYAKLHVNGDAGALSVNHSKYFSAFDNLTWKYEARSDLSIYASGIICSASQFLSHTGTISASDTRIKKNIVDADDVECLETLRLLKPKKYQYKDVIERGEEPVWGFIAQEVRDTLPYATQLRRDVLPNIYELANVSQSNVITFTNFNTSNLESNATTLIRTKGIDGQDRDIHLVEVIDEHTIRVEEDLSDWTGSVDAEGNVITQIETTTLTPEEYEALKDTSGYVANISGYQNANVPISVEEYNALEDTTGYEAIIENYTKTITIYPGTQLFVYGQEVDDFIFVKKEAIWTVATAALQEVDRQLQAERVRNDSLEARILALENK